ncbi:MAG: EAL domain-containing protein [Blautia sp.]|nr:EAL domain-containing protein [Blautia sp.]
MKDNLHVLNRIFEKALAHPASATAIPGLLAFLGEELGCERVSVFEAGRDGGCDNTYEWCAEGIPSQKEQRQHLPVSWPGMWKNGIPEDKVIIIRDMEKLRDTDPVVYDRFRLRQVRVAAACALSLGSRTRGLFLLENPAEETLDSVESIMPGMRYILSSLVQNDHLIHQLEKIGFSDNLTGTGNRMSLQRLLDTLQEDVPVGMIYCDVLGWDVDDGHPDHLDNEQMFLHTAVVLENLFDEQKEVFRIADGEFLVLQSPVEKESFETSVKIIKNLFKEQDLLVAMGVMWVSECEGGFDAGIRDVHMRMYNDKRALMAQRENNLQFQRKNRSIEQSKADITLPVGEEFFRSISKWLADRYDENVITIVIDINYFKLFNDIFGRQAGNAFLESIADTIQQKANEEKGLAGYLGGDNFCLILPTAARDTREVEPFLQELISRLKYTDGFAPILGVYFSRDRQEASSLQYDRALTAMQEIKGSYTRNYNFYSEEHYQNIRRNKLMLMDVKKGLPRGEFFFYLQPQVHEKSGKIIGAEALMRWNLRGEVVSPGGFIELLEKTGYIFAVDCAVWEKVCRWLQSLLKRGITPVPCSVNVSRVDFYFTDVAEHFINLIKKYEIPVEYLGIEITESALTDNTDTIANAVKKLHEAGFKILMDDFGSGSSSLSMLHTMNLDVLKTDVRFMSQKKSDSKAISIVESVISMAHMIGMLVVTEGVETEDQRDDLIALGDNYAQGFYFYKPMPVEEFEKLLQQPDKIGRAPKKGDAIMRNRLTFRELIHEGMLSETLLDNIIGPAAIFKERQDNISIVQMNHPYSVMTGIAEGDEEAKAHFVMRYHHGDREKIRSILYGANEHPLNGYTDEVEFEKEDGTVVMLQARVFMLYACDDHKLYLITLQV